MIISIFQRLQCNFAIKNVLSIYLQSVRFCNVLLFIPVNIIYRQSEACIHKVLFELKRHKPEFHTGSLFSDLFVIWKENHPVAAGIFLMFTLQ